MKPSGTELSATHLELGIALSGSGSSVEPEVEADPESRRRDDTLCGPQHLNSLSFGDHDADIAQLFAGAAVV